jgi:hypothetical protein
VRYVADFLYLRIRFALFGGEYSGKCKKIV